MSFTLKIGAALAALAMPATAMAQAQSSCMTEAEATALFSYALPEMLQTVAKKCSASLPANSFMSTRAPALVASYRSAAAPGWPIAKVAFLKTAGDEKSDAGRILAQMSDDALKSLVSTALNVVVGDGIKPADCPRIDSMVAALAPLPISNISSLLVNILLLAGSDKEQQFKICPK